MSHELVYIWIPAAILFLPLAAFVVLIAGGKRLDRSADKLAIGTMFSGFVLSVVLFAQNAGTHAFTAQAQPVISSFSWMNLAGVDLQMGLLVDNLSAFMSIIVTGLATLVLLYSIFYMHGDSMYRRYFAYMCFFCFAMLGVVFSSNLLMTFVFWELVGLGSYFLIGFWYYKPPVAQDEHYQHAKPDYATGIDERYLSPSFAQKKAFVMNRIGDFGFVLGLCLLAVVAVSAAAVPGFKDLALQNGPLNFDKLYLAREHGVFDTISLLGLSGSGLLTLAGIFIFMGAMGKSAQFPLHTWLPDAMQGPTTGSSIIHAATMVAAGVYLTARIHPLLTDGSLFFVAAIGGITAILAASMAMVQWDIKAVLAYSTISQLGYMMVGLGAGAYTAGLAHLFTHAIFKCMLFLCAGVVIHSCLHLQDMNRFGGLRRKLPLTYLATLAGTLAITGVPFFSGFFSKDAVLAGSLARALEYGSVHWIPTVLAFITAGLTAFYMFRLLFLTFHGKPRDQQVYDHAHEAPRVATVPLLILAVLCLGFWWGGHLWGGTALAVPGVSVATQAFKVQDGSVIPATVTKGWLDALIVSPVSTEATGIAPGAVELAHHVELHHTAHVYATGLSVLLLLLGAGLAWWIFYLRRVAPERLLQFAPLGLLYALFSQLWFFDRLYQDGIVPALKRLNHWAWRFDARVVDGVLVDGWAVILRAFAAVSGAFDNWVVDKFVDLFGSTTWWLGRITRSLQAGQIQFYAGVSFGVAVVVLLAVMLASGK